MIRVLWMSVLLIPQIALCQNLPVQFTGTIEEIEEGKFVMKIAATLKDGWCVYSDSNSLETVSGLTVWLTDGRICQAERIQCLNKSISMYDDVVRNKVNVYYGDVNYRQVLKINEEVPNIIEVIVECYIGNGKKIIPVSSTENFCVLKNN